MRVRERERERQGAMFKFVIEKQQRFIEWRKNYRSEFGVGGSASVWNGSDLRKTVQKGEFGSKGDGTGFKYRRAPRYADGPSGYFRKNSFWISLIYSF